MGRILRIGYRHIDAIRSNVLRALCCTLGSAYSVRKRVANECDFLLPYIPALDDNAAIVAAGAQALPRVGSLLNSAIELYEMDHPKDPEVGPYLEQASISTFNSSHRDEDDFGTERGGKWDAAGLVLRGGLALTLGALEAFQRGVIRAILVHSSAGSNGRNNLVQATLSDFKNTSTEEWQQLERDRKLWTCGGRKDYLSKQFDISAHPLGETRKRLNESWDIRNDIVHGYDAPPVTIRDYLQCHYDVYNSMAHLASQCMERVQIEI